MELEDFYEDVGSETSETQERTSDGSKKPLPFFMEAAENIERAGYKSGWINKNVDTSDPYTFFIKPKNRYGYKSECPHFQGIWLSGGFSSLKCAICPIPVPGLHWGLTCSKDYAQCPFYNRESIEDYDIQYLGDCEIQGNGAKKRGQELRKWIKQAWDQRKGTKIKPSEIGGKIKEL